MVVRRAETMLMIQVTGDVIVVNLDECTGTHVKIYSQDLTHSVCTNCSQASMEILHQCKRLHCANSFFPAYPTYSTKPYTKHFHADYICFNHPWENLPSNEIFDNNLIIYLTMFVVNLVNFSIVRRHTHTHKKTWHNHHRILSQDSVQCVVVAAASTTALGTRETHTRCINIGGCRRADTALANCILYLPPGKRVVRAMICRLFQCINLYLVFFGKRC